MMVDADIQKTFVEVPETQPLFGEVSLPEVIQGQIDKLKQLDACVKTAFDAAEDAEKRAVLASRSSAGRALFTDKKKEAIEELQMAGIQLAGAVQSGAKAQKLSFEFQARLAEVTKYLFSLGVRNIAANRVVVRELELRLSGASEEELSDLARQEVLSVVRQLKEQEDLQKKQEKMGEAIKQHEFKIRDVREQVDVQERMLENQKEQYAFLVNFIESVTQASKQQQQDISALQQQLQAQRAHMDNLSAELARGSSQSEQAAKRLRASLNLRTALLAILTIASPAVVYFFR